MRGLKTLIGATALLAGLAMAPAESQICCRIGVPPVCQWGYYEAPLTLRPMILRAGYFYNASSSAWALAGWAMATAGEHRFHGEAEAATRPRRFEAEHGHYAHGYDDRATRTARRRSPRWTARRWRTSRGGAPHGGGAHVVEHPTVARSARWRSARCADTLWRARNQ